MAINTQFEENRKKILGDKYTPASSVVGSSGISPQFQQMRQNIMSQPQNWQNKSQQEEQQQQQPEVVKVSEQPKSIFDQFQGTYQDFIKKTGNVIDSIFSKKPEVGKVTLTEEQKKSVSGVKMPSLDIGAKEPSSAKLTPEAQKKADATFQKVKPFLENPIDTLISTAQESLYKQALKYQQGGYAIDSSSPPCTLR